MSSPIAAALLVVALAAPPTDMPRPGPLGSAATTLAVEPNVGATTAAQAWTPELTAAHRDDTSTVPQRKVSPARQWEMRDRRLVITSAVSGGIFGVSSIAAIVLAVEIRKSIDRCSATTYTQCEETRDRVGQLRTPAIAVATIVGASLVALLVSGIMLGVHRSRRPEIAGRGASRFALSPSGLRLRF